MESNNNLEIIAAAKILLLISNTDGIIDKKNIICAFYMIFWYFNRWSFTNLVKSKKELKKSDDV